MCSPSRGNRKGRITATHTMMRQQRQYMRTLNDVASEPELYIYTRQNTNKEERHYRFFFNQVSPKTKQGSMVCAARLCYSA